jgi:hypothetical protein
LIADPGTGKTPITAVMVSEILKVGGTRGNTGKGRKIPNTLVTVSCPDVESSQKDADYPLEIFLKYGNTPPLSNRSLMLMRTGSIESVILTMLKASFSCGSGTNSTTP